MLSTNNVEYKNLWKFSHNFMSNLSVDRQTDRSKERPTQADNRDSIIMAVRPGTYLDSSVSEGIESVWGMWV